MSLPEKEIEILETIEFVRIYLESFLFKSSKELPSEMPKPILTKLRELSNLIESDTFDYLKDIFPELEDKLRESFPDVLSDEKKKKVH